MGERKLTARQQAFVGEYLIDLNATQAAIRAGYSARTAEQQGPRLLGNVGVAQAIAERRKVRERRTEITADRVLHALAAVAFGDLRTLFSDAGELRPVHELPDEAVAMLSGVDVVTVSKGEGAVEHVARIRTNDRLKALDLIGRHLGMFPSKVELSGRDGGPIETAELSDTERAAKLAALLASAARRAGDA